MLQGIDLVVAPGQIFALLGPNGAGKTTTIEILEDSAKLATARPACWARTRRRGGSSWRERIGIVLQSSVPEPDLTVRETLDLYAGFYSQPRSVHVLLETCGLTEQADTRNGRLSGGQQRRLDVALALVGHPELLFHDAPTTGFDPAARRAAWEMIGTLRDLGTTIVLTTHYLEEAEALADWIAVIDQGRIVAEGTPAELGGRRDAPTIITFRPPERATLPVEAERTGDGRARIVTTHPTAALHELTAWATDHGMELEELDVHRPTLEDVYLELTRGAIVA